MSVTFEAFGEKENLNDNLQVYEGYLVYHHSFRGQVRVACYGDRASQNHTVQV